VATVRIPTPLRRLTGNQAKVTVGGSTIAELVAALEAAYPGIRDRLVDDTGEIKRFVNVFVNGDEIRTLQGAATPLKEGDEVSIIPAMAGGADALNCLCCRRV
jgi:molybdopterin synthase sulfur carrier subunit